MCSDKLAARDGSAHRKLSRKQRRADDLREFAGLAVTRTAKDLETLTTRTKRSAATDSRYRERWQRDTRIQISIPVQLEIRNPNCRINDIGDVLPASNEDRRQPVSQLTVVSDNVGLQVAQHRVLPHLQQAFGRDV